MLGKGFKVQLLPTLGILVGLAVCDQAFKLPIDLRSNIVPYYSEVRLKQNFPESISRRSSDSEKTLLFPDKTDESESREAQVRLSFEGQEEKSGSEKPTDEIGLQRFYKYSTKSQPEGDEVIVFPKEVVGQITNEGTSGTEEEYVEEFATDPNSDRKSFAANPGIKLEAAEINATNISQYEVLAHIVRQLLFRMSVTETPEIITTSTEPPVIDSTQSEMDILEQSLYGGPRLKSQSQTRCPEGWKITRNGSCQKPSRILQNRT